MAIRTDLAVEALEQSGIPDGVHAREYQTAEGYTVSQVEVHRDGAVPGRRAGRYLTLGLGALIRREEDAFPRACRAVAGLLRELMPEAREGTVLVAGLGNRAITPDAVGPLCCENVLATRHLAGEELFSGFRPVSVLAPGVLGTTGIEAGEVVRGVMDRVHPSLVIAVDALAARRLSRLMCTIQLTDTGITPGSGVGNARAALDERTLGVPVIAIGVPTVVDGATLAHDITEQTGSECEALGDLRSPVLVTTKDIDRQASDVARVIGYGINLALHPDLTVTDIDLFLS